MKIGRLLILLLTCATLIIGYGCTDDKVVDPGEQQQGPGGEDDID